jgi:hypothetical protein
MMVLESAKGGFETGYGRIESSWERQADGGYLYKCDIPCNTSATLYLGLNENEHVVQLGSGHYEFICNT